MPDQRPFPVPWIVGEAGKSKSGVSLARCRCVCGKTFVAARADVLRGHTKSCGCLSNALRSTAISTHGMSKTPTYLSWVNMLARCHRKSHPRYADYGGRGIVVCERWLTFANFLEDMGEKPTPAHTIERKDNDKGYEPGNCRWATKAEQNRNTRANRLLTHDGKTLSLAEWADLLEIRLGTLSARLRYGWSVEKTLTTPVRRW